MGPLIRQEPDADVYAIQTLDETDQDLEAKAYMLNDIPKFELRTRKRSMQKLQARQICSVDQAGRKFIVYCTNGISPQELEFILSSMSTHGSIDAKLNYNAAPVVAETKSSQHTVSTTIEFGPTLQGQKKRRRKRGLRKLRVSAPNGARQLTTTPVNEFLSPWSHLGNLRSFRTIIDFNGVFWSLFRSTHQARMYVRGLTTIAKCAIDTHECAESGRSWRCILHELDRALLARRWGTPSGLISVRSPYLVWTIQIPFL